MLYANQHAATPSMKQGGRPDNNETPDLLLPSTPYLRSLVSEDNILHNGYQTPMNSKEEHNGVHHGSSGLNVAMCTPDATVEKFLVGGYDVRQVRILCDFKAQQLCWNSVISLDMVGIERKIFSYILRLIAVKLLDGCWHCS